MTEPRFDFEAAVKDLIADPRNRIRLDDLISEKLQAALDALNPERFSTSLPPATSETVTERIGTYESAIEDLMVLGILIGRWGEPYQFPSLVRIFARLASLNEQGGGFRRFANVPEWRNW